MSIALGKWRTTRRRTLGRLIVVCALGAVVVWSVRATIAFGSSVSADAPATAQAAFDAAHRRFQQGRQLQRLHRNTPASTDALAAALGGYEAVAQDADGTPLGARALYMSGSTLLFLDRSGDAIRRYAEVGSRYAADPYAAKALVRKASVEKNSLDAEAARRTLASVTGSEAVAGDLARIRRALEVIGEPGPDLAARTWIGGEPVSLAAMRGDVVLLYFFATWCPNCEKEVDFIRGLATRWASSGVRILGVTDHSRGQTDATVAAYVERHRLGFPVMVDDDGRTSAAYRGGSVPTLVVIDRAGIVRWHDHPAALADAVLAQVTGDAA